MQILHNHENMIAPAFKFNVKQTQHWVPKIHKVKSGQEQGDAHNDLLKVSCLVAHIKGQSSACLTVAGQVPSLRNIIPIFEDTKSKN